MDETSTPLGSCDISAARVRPIIGFMRMRPALSSANLLEPAAPLLNAHGSG
jgi:hypothetical protein